MRKYSRTIFNGVFIADIYLRYVRGYGLFPKWDQLARTVTHVEPLFRISHCCHRAYHRARLRLRRWRWYESGRLLLLTIRIHSRRIRETAIENTRYTAVVQFNFSRADANVNLLLLIIIYLFFFRVVLNN